MTSWLLFFILLNPNSSSNFQLYIRTITPPELICNLDHIGSSSFDKPINPTAYFIQDDNNPGKFCRVDITKDMAKLSNGTYLESMVFSGGGSFSLHGLGKSELFIKQ